MDLYSRSVIIASGINMVVPKEDCKIIVNEYSKLHHPSTLNSNNHEVEYINKSKYLKKFPKSGVKIFLSSIFYRFIKIDTISSDKTVVMTNSSKEILL